MLHSRLIRGLEEGKNLPHTQLTSAASWSIMPYHLSCKRMQPRIYFSHLINMYEDFIPVLTHTYYN